MKQESPVEQPVAASILEPTSGPTPSQTPILNSETGPEPSPVPVSLMPEFENTVDYSHQSSSMPDTTSPLASNTYTLASLQPLPMHNATNAEPFHINTTTALPISQDAYLPLQTLAATGHAEFAASPSSPLQSTSLSTLNSSHFVSPIEELPTPLAEENENDVYEDKQVLSTALTTTFEGQNFPHVSLSTLPPSINAAVGIAQGISSKLSDPMTSSIFHHFIRWTCPSLDPTHAKMADNNSIKYYLPIAVNSPSCFHGLLALSSMQLREANSNFAESAIRHRTLSLRHLSREIQEKKHIYDPVVLAGILCQITLDVMEVKSTEWRAHLNICRSTVKKMLAECNDYVAWFVACRIAKYDTFASLIDGHQPIISLQSFENTNLAKHFEVLWGLPPTWCLYCATITYWAKMPPSPAKQRELDYINSRLQSYFPFYSTALPTNVTLSQQVEVIWQISTFIHFTRVTSPVRLDLIPFINSLFVTAMRLLTSFPPSDFKGTAFSWPLFVLTSVAFTPEDRASLENIIVSFWRSLRITTFGHILDISKSMWAADHKSMTGEEYADFVQSHLTILLA